MQDNYTVRTMRADEVPLAVQWAAQEGWNPGLDDAGLFFKADPQGFLVGLLDGEPIATISAVKYGKTFGFVGFYIVQSEYRGKGYGLRLWDAAMQALAGRVVGLDGVVAQQGNYRKSGFEPAYRNVRYEGRCGGVAPEHSGLVDISGQSLESAVAYDRQFFPDDRAQFLRAWLSQPRAKAFGILAEGRLAGYGVIRQCRSGYKIGPLFADNDDYAEVLFQALRSGYSAEVPLYLDVPEVNSQAVSLAQGHDMSVVFETARMYAGQVPDIPVDRIFGVTSFELG
ncbi:GNAT family N-acetyltransferase [Desulfovibrio ferrophilus]|uniref:GCN5-related N-acetyltransferase n=1 Tax=Desulfovibrio ferrophilus TaxID=241368 RepID=A0A2Z6AY27_9BACT|nr:GNAT family N-acetyltransferase [Desulfovibrio ferrophilus]BBD08149.1 GCN5-related N-acetyltransferase [Desulfovibrio ferrophilus]